MGRGQEPNLSETLQSSLLRGKIATHLEIDELTKITASGNKGLTLGEIDELLDIDHEAPLHSLKKKKTEIEKVILKIDQDPLSLYDDSARREILETKEKDLSSKDQLIAWSLNHKDLFQYALETLDHDISFYEKENTSKENIEKILQKKPLPKTENLQAFLNSLNWRQVAEIDQSFNKDFGGIEKILNGETSLLRFRKENGYRVLAVQGNPYSGPDDLICVKIGYLILDDKRIIHQGEKEVVTKRNALEILRGRDLDYFKDSPRLKKALGKTLDQDLADFLTA